MRNLAERLEELAAAYGQAATSPDPAVIWRRRRRRRQRIAAGAAVLAMALAAGAVVAANRTSAPPVAAAAQVVIRPQEGYRLKVPADWRVTPRVEPRLIVLQLPMTLQHPAVDVRVGTAISLDPHLTSASDRNAAVLPSLGDIRIQRVYRHVSYGKRPDGRPFLRSEEAFSDQLAAAYQVSWPYHCAQGAPCPALARLRVLELWTQTSAGDWPQVRPAIERLVQAVQPIGNAVSGAATPHPPCRTGRNGDVWDPYPAFGASPDGSALRFTLGAVSRLVLPCHFHAKVGVELLEVFTVVNDPETEKATHVYTHEVSRPAPVRGNGIVTLLDGDLPEGGADGTGALAATFEWSNWCGGTKATRVDGLKVLDREVKIWRVTNGHRDWLLQPRQLPRCVNPAAPSVLRIVTR
jgi:hypothetical protein